METTRYYAEIRIDDAELKKTMDELQAAVETVRKCYSKLNAMNVLRICAKKPSAATDG